MKKEQHKVLSKEVMHELLVLLRSPLIPEDVKKPIVESLKKNPIHYYQGVHHESD